MCKEQKHRSEINNSKIKIYLLLLLLLFIVAKNNFESYIKVSFYFEHLNYFLSCIEKQNIFFLSLFTFIKIYSSFNHFFYNLIL